MDGVIVTSTTGLQILVWKPEACFHVSTILRFQLVLNPHDSIFGCVGAARGEQRLEWFFSQFIQVCMKCGFSYWHPVIFSLSTTIFGCPCWPNDRMPVSGTLASFLKPVAPSIFVQGQWLKLMICPTSHTFGRQQNREVAGRYQTVWRDVTRGRFAVLSALTHFLKCGANNRSKGWIPSLRGHSLSGRSQIRLTKDNFKVRYFVCISDL